MAEVFAEGQTIRFAEAGTEAAFAEAKAGGQPLHAERLRQATRVVAVDGFEELAAGAGTGDLARGRASGRFHHAEENF